MDTALTLRVDKLFAPRVTGVVGYMDIHVLCVEAPDKSIGTARRALRRPITRHKIQGAVKRNGTIVLPVMAVVNALIVMAMV